MSFLELAKKRYSVRKYLPQKVEKEKLLAILEAGRVAPSAHRCQPAKIIVVEATEGLDKIKQTAKVYDAPLVLIICGDRDAAWIRPYDHKNYVDIDATIVIDHMALQATELGLGTLWIGNFDPKIIKQEFNLPDNIDPVNLLAIGYAATSPASPNRHDKERKPMTDFVTYENF